MHLRALTIYTSLLALSGCVDSGGGATTENGESAPTTGVAPTEATPTSGLTTPETGPDTGPDTGSTSPTGPDTGAETGSTSATSDTAAETETGATSDTAAETETGGDPMASSCNDTACAFPGAEGFGTATPGGRGGQVIIVKNLNADGPGSFREAMLTPGPRIIVFAVSGVIDLEGEVIELLEEHSFVTVAGQSSPGGITLKNAALSSYHANFHDAVFRFLRLRGPDVYDNLSFATTYNLVFDHMDFSGGSDECFDVTYSHDYTVQWSTITNSTKGDDSQNYGALIAYKPTTNISIHHNLMAHHFGRCGAQIHYGGDEPPPDGGAQLDFRNNVTYNCGTQQILRVDEAPPTGLFYNLVGNYAKSGPDTPAESMIFGLSGDIHIADNVYEGQSIILTPFFMGNQLGAPFAYPPITTTTSAEAFDQVLARAGAWPRDAMVTRTVAEVLAGTGTLGKQDDPLNTDGPPAPADGDEDGMPDAWEMAHGLDPADGADASALTPSGYSNVEVYLAERAAEVVAP